MTQSFDEIVRETLFFDGQEHQVDIAALKHVLTSNRNRILPGCPEAKKFRPIVTSNMTVGISAYQGSNEQAEIVTWALSVYAHLIKSVASKRYSFAEFADAIEMHYSADNIRTAEVLRTLRELDKIN